MKTKVALFSSLMLLSSTVAFSQDSTCKPESNSRWKNATVSALPDATQEWLLHVRATGIYLAADLICNLGDCTGYINGAADSAQLKLDPKDSSKVESVTIAGDPGVPKVTFICN